MEVPNGAASLDLLATTEPKAVVEMAHRAALLWSVIPPEVRATVTWCAVPSAAATAMTGATSSPPPTSPCAEPASGAIAR